MAALDSSAGAIALNRVLPESLAAWSPDTDSDEARAFVRYAHGHVALQARARARLVEHAARVIAIEDAAALDASHRLDALASLGEPLRDALRR